MVALRALWGQDRADPKHVPAARDVDPDADWLTVQQAACEFGVSDRTVRRMIGHGQLASRPTADGERGLLRVHVPGARHARMMANSPANVIDIATRMPVRGESADQEAVHHLERQVEDLSEALSRALRTRQRSIPSGLRAAVASAQPYASYRWLARRRRWWPFSSS